MVIPVIHPPIPSQRYDCHGCTNCCRDLVVQLTPADRKKIDAGGWADRLGVSPYVRAGRITALNHKPDGGCVFLSEDGQCRIHAEDGMTAKPLACRIFPFTLTPGDDALHASFRFDCPSVAKNDGSPLSKHRSELNRLAKSLAESALSEIAPAPSEYLLDKYHRLKDRTVDHLIEQLERWISDRKRPIHRRLIGLSEWVRTLASTKLNRFDDDRLIELTTLLMSDMDAAASSIESKPLDPPSPRQLKMLYQSVFSHCEHVTLEEARVSLLKRTAIYWDQFKRTRRLSPGRGPIPRLGTLPEGGRIEQVHAVQPDANLPEKECDSLLTRYLQARITGRSAFGRGYYGWPILDGLQALLLSIATIGWLTRRVAVLNGRTVYRFEDVVAAVGLVDRTTGRAPELGAHSARMRLRFLTEDNGLLRLLTTYPILPSPSPEGSAYPHQVPTDSASM